MKKMLSSVVMIGLLLFMFFILTAHPFQATNSPQAVAGHLNLTDWRFEKQGTLKISGEFEVYEGQLLTPEHFNGTVVELETGAQAETVTESATATDANLSGYFNPATNRSFKNDLGPLNSELGVRTFRLRITLAEIPEQALALKMNNISNSSVLYVNGQKIGSNGTVALEQHNYEADAKGYDAYFETNRSELEIILQVASYSDFSYPFYYNMWLGTANSIALQTAFGIAIELCGAALCFIIFLYHLYIAVYTRSKRYLYFSLLFLFLSLIFLVSGEMLIWRLFGHIPFEIQIKLRGMLRVLMGMMFQLYLVNAIKGLLPAKVHKVIIAVSSFIVMAILVLDVEAYSKVVDYFYFYLMLTLIFKFVNVLRVWQSQRFQLSLNSAFVYVIILFCWMTSYLNNTLYALGFVTNKAVGSLAISLFIVLSQLLLAFRYIRNVHHVKELEQAKEEFFVNSAYYLRAPLDSILTITSQMMAAKPVDNQLGIIKQLSLQMIRHVSDIKDLTLLKYDQLKLNFVSISLQSILERALEGIAIVRNESESPVSVKLNTARNLMVLGDEERVRQVLHTLISQAANHEGVTSVHITSIVEKNEIVIHIHDNGEAISLYKQERLFHSDYIDDTDIGFKLYMIRELVQAMGGSLSLAWSAENESNCIELRLSGYETKEMQIIDEQLIELRTDRLLPSWSEFSEHKEQQQTILIVEDQYYNIQTLLGMLHSQNLNLIYAYSGEEAQHMLSAYDVDLVLMDVGLQHQSGIAICRAMRAQYTVIELPIILMSISMSAEELEQGFSAGANDYIRKPFVQQEIIARVKSQLAIRKSLELAMQNELAFLQAQIEPHFIYNAINSVISLCYTDPMKGAEVLTDFSQYLRLVFDIDAALQEVPLERELELIEVYVNIERVRFGEKFKLMLDVPEQLRSVKIPSFCIQPLVENAIKHGLYHKPEGGTIHVQVSSDEEKLYIAVLDDGVGMPEELVEQLLNGEAGGIGFNNVKKRLAHLPSGTIQLISEQGVGTSVTISFIREEHCFH